MTVFNTAERRIGKHSYKFKYGTFEDDPSDNRYMTIDVDGAVPPIWYDLTLYLSSGDMLTDDSFDKTKNNVPPNGFSGIVSYCRIYLELELYKSIDLQSYMDQYAA